MDYLDENKAKIARSDALRLLVDLARSKDKRVQRNATGALLNMTHSRMFFFYISHQGSVISQVPVLKTFFTEENRQQLVYANAIPVLTSLLNSDDQDVQYYCTTALSNIAVDGKFHNIQLIKFNSNNRR